MVDRVIGFQVGGVAQLGEHLLCKQGVTGSIPVVSTTDACAASGEAVELSTPATRRGGGNRLLANDESRSPLGSAPVVSRNVPNSVWLHGSGKASWAVGHAV